MPHREYRLNIKRDYCVLKNIFYLLGQRLWQTLQVEVRNVFLIHKF